MLLRACSAVCGTELAYAEAGGGEGHPHVSGDRQSPIALRRRYAMSGTDIACAQLPTNTLRHVRKKKFLITDANDKAGYHSLSSYAVPTRCPVMRVWHCDRERCCAMCSTDIPVARAFVGAVRC
eukprot:2860718-Rhodomonas_salina.1